MSEKLKAKVLDKLAMNMSEIINPTHSPVSWKDITKIWLDEDDDFDQKLDTRYVVEIIEKTVSLAFAAKDEEAEKEIKAIEGLELVKWSDGSVKDYNKGRLFACKELRGCLLAENSEAKKR